MGLRRSSLSLQEAWKLGRQVAIRAIRGQLLPSGIQRNDSRALGPEGSDDWEKRALEHMGGAIWSSLEQFGWDHLGSPGISEGHQDSGSWGQLGDPRRLPLCVLWFWLWLCFHPSSVLRGSFFYFFFDRNDRRPQGGRASPSASPGCTAPAAGDTVSPQTDSQDKSTHTHTHAHMHTCTHTLSFSYSGCLDQNSALQTSGQPSASILPILTVCRSASPAQLRHPLWPLCHSPALPGSKVPAARLGPLIVVPSFLLIPAGLLDTVGTNPSAAAVVPLLQHPYRIRAVRCWAAHTPTPTRTCAATPTSSLFCSGPKTSQNDKGTGRGTEQDHRTGQPRQNGTMAVPRVYLPAPAPSPSPYVPIYISPLPSLCKWMSSFWSSTCLLFFTLLAVCSLFAGKGKQAMC